MDFTLTSYKNLLQTLQAQGYTFITFHDYLIPTTNPQLVTCLPTGRLETRNSSPETRLLLLRHDVDLLPQNSLATAKMEHELGIKGSYYFRMVPESYDVGIIKKIAEMGHEVGYHYETMDSASGLSDEFRVTSLKQDNSDELIDAAYQQFCENLEEFREVADVKTICMHGSPRSKYDNRDIWTKYSYKELGLIGEPYFDVNFDDFFYLTDTGRRWDGHRVSVRDKMPQQERWTSEGLTFRSTKHIIRAANEKRLPARIMITVHPQRWSDSFFSWTKELVVQNLKNVVKKMIVKNSKR